MPEMEFYDEHDAEWLFLIFHKVDMYKNPFSLLSLLR